MATERPRTAPLRSSQQLAIVGGALPDEGGSLDRLLADCRAAREAVHGLIVRMRIDRAAWDRDLATLSLRQRLTQQQRQVLQRRRATGVTRP